MCRAASAPTEYDAIIGAAFGLLLRFLISVLYFPSVSPSQRFLEGRVALVTGAGRGCGEAVAVALGAAGARVCASDLNPDRASRVADTIIRSGGEAFGWQTDVSNKLQVGSLIETVRDRYARLDILIQHAHVGPHVTLLTLDEWEWRRTIDVNLTGAFFCAQLAGRVMADEGGGWIGLLVRPGAAGGQEGGGALAAAEAGLGHLAQAFSREIGAKGVRVAALDADGVDDTVIRVLDFLRQPSVE